MTTDRALEKQIHSMGEEAPPTSWLLLELTCLPVPCGPAQLPSPLPLHQTSQSALPAAHTPQFSWPNWKGFLSSPSRKNMVSCVIMSKSGTSLGLYFFAYKTNLILPSLPALQGSYKNEINCILSPIVHLLKVNRLFMFQ